MMRFVLLLILVACCVSSLAGCSDLTNGSQANSAAIDAQFQQVQEKIHAGDEDGGLQILNALLASEPEHAGALTARGMLYHARGEYALAIADLDKAIPLDPRSPRAAKELAWMLATCPVDEFRNGQRAVQVAKIAMMRDHEDWHNLDSLAAALAETGDFDGAIKYQMLLLQNPPPEEAAKLQERLESYQQQRPWRE